VAFVFIQGHIDLGVCGMRLATANQRVQNSLGICLSGFDFFWFSFLVLFALYLQQFGTRTCHVAKYLPHFGTLTSHVHGICYILVLQTFMWVSCGFL